MEIIGKLVENLRKSTGSTEIPKKFIGKLWENHWKNMGKSQENHWRIIGQFFGKSQGHPWNIIVSWCIPGYSPAYSRVFAGSVNGVVVGLLVSLRVLAYPVAFWRILAESFGILRKFVGLYGSQPHPRNRASRFYVLTGFHRKTIRQSSENSLEDHRNIIGTSSCNSVSRGIRLRILAYLRVLSRVP